MSVLFVDTFTTLIFTALLPPFVGLVTFLVILASLGKTLGLRQKYVDILLKIFEFGKQRLAKSKLYNSLDGSADCKDSSYDSSIDTIDEEPIAPTQKTSGDENDELHHGETHEFELSDVFGHLRKGIGAIVDDEVTKRFAAEELTSWNFLTRTNVDYEFISIRLTVFWFLGFLFRYFVLLPIRVCILFIGVWYLVTFTAIMAFMPDGKFKQVIGHYSFLTSFRIIGRAISAVIRFHDREYKPKPDGICVANHTSPIDCVILAGDVIYAFVGQRHGGLLGIFQRALSRASDHIWFERGESKDRYAVAKRLRDHVEDPNKMPILIFPEGTCINNTSVMQFKKGTFEVGGIIYPVAIKYDPRFGDAFWNSSKFAMMSYLYMMMTSWAIVCDVWYLPPMQRLESETSIQFANRVKAEIARRGGLVDLVWDGGLKRSAPKKEWRQQYQQQFSKTLKLHNVNKGISTNKSDDDDEEKKEKLLSDVVENNLAKNILNDFKSSLDAKNVISVKMNNVNNFNDKIVNEFSSNKLVSHDQTVNSYRDVKCGKVD